VNHYPRVGDPVIGLAAGQWSAMSGVWGTVGQGKNREARISPFGATPTFCLSKCHLSYLTFCRIWLYRPHPVCSGIPCGRLIIIDWPRGPAIKRQTRPQPWGSLVLQCISRNGSSGSSVSSVSSGSSGVNETADHTLQSLLDHLQTTDPQYGPYSKGLTTKQT
jgi:hypothetical protein